MPDESNANGAPVGGEEMKQNPPKNFFVRLKQRKKKKEGGGESFLTQCLLCFLSF
jgi:hypothetical protein